MEDDKIKYSDIIQPDDSIEKLIGQLEEFTKQYSTMTNAIRAGADRIVHAVRSASGATSEGRKSIDEAASATSRLERAQRELRIAMSDTGRQIAWLKAQTIDTNKATVEHQRYIRTAISSYDRLKADLKTAVSLYKSLTASERTNTEAGHEVLATILSLKREIAKLDAEMKPHIQTLSALEKAKQKLAFIQSEEGKQLLDVQNKIRAEIAARKTQKKALSEIEKARLRLINAQSSENIELKLYSQRIAEANQIAKLQAQIANSAEGSYNRLSAQYSLNKIRLNAMSAEQRNATESGKALEQETLQLYLQMQKLQEATGNYRLSVGHYQRAFNGLGFSVSQVVRELPALAVSANTFFLAISNNIPLVVDEIVKLRAQNKLLQAEGKATVSVTRSIIKSLFSWNTALVVVLSVLSIFGKDLLDWAKNIAGASKRVIDLKDALKNIAAELGDTNASFGSNVVKVKSLQAEWKNLKTTAEKKQWILDNKTEFNNLGIAVGNVTDAENIFVDNTSFVIEALKLRAKAAAASKLAEEAYRKSLVKRNEAETAGQTGPSAEDRAKAAAVSISLNTSRGGGIAGTVPIRNQQIEGPSAEDFKKRRIKGLEDEARAAEATGDAYFDLADGYEAAAKAELEKAGIKASHKKGKTDPEGRDLTDAVNRMALSVQKKYEQSITKLERDEYAKRKKEAKDAAAAKIRELKETYRKNEDYLNDEEGKYKELTSNEIALIQQAQEQICAAITNTQDQLNHELYTIEIERQISELETVRETIQLRLQYVEKGAEEELRLLLELLAAEEQIALKRNALLPVGQSQLSSDISIGFGKKRAKTTSSFELNAFDEQQALEEATFNATKHSEIEITKFKLSQEIDRWKKQIDLAESGSLDWSQAQIGAAKETVKGLERELEEAGSFVERWSEQGLEGALLERMGLDDEQIGAVKDAYSVMAEAVLGCLQSIYDAEVELAEKEVELAEERVSAAQSALDAEIEARNNGYANNVATAKKELQLQKQNQLKKQKLLEEAQRKQQAVDTVMQASNLITGASAIWATSMKLGPVAGPILASIVTATMFGAFVASKIKAAEAAKASQAYGEGGLEILEGGSHASGDDIDLNTKNSRGKNMRAEGGEALAIINKRSTRRYRKQLPYVIKALNNGTFEDKYMRAFEAGDALQQCYFSTSSDVNLSTIESELAEIRKQSTRRIYTTANGTTVIIDKNVKRYIR